MAVQLVPRLWTEGTIPSMRTLKHTVSRVLPNRIPRRARAGRASGTKALWLVRNPDAKKGGERGRGGSKRGVPGSGSLWSSPVWLAGLDAHSFSFDRHYRNSITVSGADYEASIRTPIPISRTSQTLPSSPRVSAEFDGDKQHLALPDVAPKQLRPAIIRGSPFPSTRSVL